MDPDVPVTREAWLGRALFGTAAGITAVWLVVLGRALTFSFDG
jgi:hypothetical protein